RPPHTVTSSRPSRSSHRKCAAAGATLYRTPCAARDRTSTTVAVNPAPSATPRSPLHHCRPFIVAPGRRPLTGPSRKKKGAIRTGVVRSRPATHGADELRAPWSAPRGGRLSVHPRHEVATGVALTAEGA